MTHDGKQEPAEERRDEALDGMLAELRRSYNVPPAPPLDAMWGRIQSQRFGARRAARGGRRTWWLGLAAALVVGVGIGRMTSPRPHEVGIAEASRPAPRDARPAHDTTSYDQTTARYLGQTAALLIALPGEARAGRADHRFVARAVELLMTTRLLLDSPAAADPKVRALLEDVELVLAQVAQLESERGRVELELITQALEQRDLLPRLHSAVAGSSNEADN
jgi:hypothetical protein